VLSVGHPSCLRCSETLCEEVQLERSVINACAAQMMMKLIMLLFVMMMMLRMMMMMIDDADMVKKIESRN
jgi:hypothetical protein